MVKDLTKLYQNGCFDVCLVCKNTKEEGNVMQYKLVKTTKQYEQVMFSCQCGARYTVKFKNK